MEVVTTLTPEAIEAAIAPVEWHEEDQRRAVCDVPPIVKPAAEPAGQSDYRPPSDEEMNRELDRAEQQSRD